MLLPVFAALALTAGPVSMQFDGSLKDALQQIAQKGGLNLVVIGDFDEKVQVHLADASAEEALDTVAVAYHLGVTRQGKVWVIKRAAAPVAEVATPVAPVPPVAPVTPVAPVAPEMTAAAHDAEEAAREQAQEAAELKRELAEVRRDETDADAELAKQRVSAGGPVTVEKGSRVETAVAYGGPVIVEEEAEVTGDAVAFGGDVVVKRGAVVKGDAVSFGGRVVKESGATVRGDTVSLGASSLGASMAKNFVRTQRAVDTDDGARVHGTGHVGRSIAGFLARFGVFFGLGFVMMLFAPQRMRALERTVRAEPGRNALAGFLGLIAAVPLTVMLAVTLIGIPVAVLLWVGLALVIPVGLAVVANAVGASLPTGRLRKTQALALGLGLLALMLAAEIPVLGPMILSLAIFVSLGAVLRTRFGQPPRGTPVLDPTHSASIA